jgi:F-type H+-transporting ATPase subunit gamma
MPNLKEVRTRISSVKDTQQITRAMKMVASAKLRKAEQSAKKYRVFKQKIEEVTVSLSVKTDPKEHFLLSPNGSNNTGIIIITSDRGLCGSFNSNLLKSVYKFINESKADDISIWVIGRKGVGFANKHKLNIQDSMTGIYRHLDISVADKIGADIMEAYEQKKIGKVKIFYNYFKSTMLQEVTQKLLLPINDNIEQIYEKNPDLKKRIQESEIDYLYEPSETKILYKLLPMYISSEIYSAILESYAGELASRMTAMESATNNCDEKIKELTILYNRQRQAAITKEISEIVGGANALEE